MMRIQHTRGRSRRTALLYGTTVGMSVNRLLRGQLRYMREKGWDVHVACAPGPELREAQDREGFIVHDLPMAREISPVADLRSLVHWIALLMKLRPAVTSVSTPKAALLGSIASFITRVPKRVYVVRGLRLEGATGSLRRLLAMLERITIRLSTDVIAVSPSLADALRQEGLVRSGQTIHVIREGSSNGVDAHAVKAAVTEEQTRLLREELGLSDRLVVGYLGRISPDKGLDTLAKAISTPPLAARDDWTLLCVGGIESRETLETLTKHARDLVHVDHTSAPWRYLGAMDVLCLPTRREGFPNVVLEAGALSIPTVSTNATGAVDAVVDGITGITVQIDDAAALSGALFTLVDDHDTRARMGRAAAERVERDFRPELIWDGLHDLYTAPPLHAKRTQAA